jgi:hypothetical protein
VKGVGVSDVRCIVSDTTGFRVQGLGLRVCG